MGTTPQRAWRALQAAIERLLIDPEFLFRIERDPAGAAPAQPSLTVTPISAAEAQGPPFTSERTRTRT